MTSGRQTAAARRSDRSGGDDRLGGSGEPQAGRVGRPRRMRHDAVKPSPLGLMILALLSERPMHPYEMQRLMVARGDDRVVRVQRGSLYPAVERLEQAGLVEADTVERSGKRPERTVY